MSERAITTRTVLITYFPMFIATLSLCTSIFNGYLNMRFLNFIERNTSRVEYMKTCKEIIDGYFQVKFRAGLLSAAGARARANGTTVPPESTEEAEANQAVTRFAALGTYLANLRDETTREQYTTLSDELDKAVSRASQIPASELDGLFNKADAIFAGLNNDCVKSAKDNLM
jgi:hypothetical protein